MKLQKSMIGRYPVMTDGKTIIAFDCDVFEKLGTKTIYHIGNQSNHYYSNNPQAIIDKVGKCGKTETRPTELVLVEQPHFYPVHYKFVKYIA